MSNLSVIETKSLVKTYNDKKVVNSVNLEILKAENFGILGPNGAGKSTTMEMMYCNTQITDGELYVLGLNAKKNPAEIKSRIGIVPQDEGLDPEFNVVLNLLLFASYNDIDAVVAKQRADNLLRRFNLEEYSRHSIYEISGGTRKRLAIARSLINQPEILFLDEPTSGLDPKARQQIWDLLRELKKEGTTIVMTTHYMEEAELLCDRIAIMDNGKVLEVGNPKEMIAKHIGIEVIEFETNEIDLNYYLNRLKEAGYSYMVSNFKVSVLIKPNQEGKKALDVFASNKIVIRKPTLNDVFLKLAGYDLKEIQ